MMQPYMVIQSPTVTAPDGMRLVVPVVVPDQTTTDGATNQRLMMVMPKSPLTPAPVPFSPYATLATANPNPASVLSPATTLSMASSVSPASFNTYPVSPQMPAPTHQQPGVMSVSLAVPPPATPVTLSPAPVFTSYKARKQAARQKPRSDLGTKHATPTPQAQSQEERNLIREMEWYLIDRCKGGSTSFVTLQRNMKESVPCLVKDVLPAYDNSWHRFINGCGTLDVFHYSAADIERLQLGSWADEHEARIRRSSDDTTGSELQDKAIAAEYAQKVRELINFCTGEVEEHQTVEIAALSRSLVERIPYFDGLSKSAFKRILIRTPYSTLWVSGNVVRYRWESEASESKTANAEAGGVVAEADGDKSL